MTSNKDKNKKANEILYAFFHNRDYSINGYINTSNK